MNPRFTATFLALVLFPLFLLAPLAKADGKYPVRIVEQSMIVFPGDEKTLQVVQIVALQNNGSVKEAELPIYLPKGYTGLEIREGAPEGGVKQIQKGIIDPTGLEAGEEKRIVLSYAMPMVQENSRWAIEQSYVTERLQVVIPSGVLSFEAANLVTQSERFEMNGREFRRFTRVDVHPNEPWTLSFRVLQSLTSGGTGASSASADPHYTSDGKKIFGHEHGAGYTKAVVTLVIVLVALSVALIGLKRDQGSRMRGGKQVRPWLMNEKMALLHQIGQLEKDYAAGLVGDETYWASSQQIREQMIRIAGELRREQIS